MTKCEKKRTEQAGRGRLRILPMIQRSRVHNRDKDVGAEMVISSGGLINLVMLISL